ncbi:cytochrome P450 3A8-like isoform X2 [Centruroides vittatus]|uniref:cytochrome P450 3A8-like isoform X2 n=1 Tax=Centruroides vittatus TaxID=120091 RepID=UPI003510658D
MADVYGIPDYVIFLLGTVLLLYLYLTRNFGFWKNRGIPEVPPMILTGSVGVDFKTNQGVLEQQWYNKYGKVFGIYEGSNPALMVGEPELLKNILVKDFYAFSEQRRVRFGDPILDRVFVLQSYERWKELRNIISPAFTSGKLRMMVKDSNYCAQGLLENFIQIARENREVVVNDYFTAFLMDVIAKCAFGVKLDSRKDPNNLFVAAIQELIGPIPWRFIIAGYFPGFAKLIRMSIFNPQTITFFRNVVLQVIRERENLKDEEKPMDFLQLMLDFKNNQDRKNEKKILDLDDVVAQCIIFVIAGFTAMTGTFIYAAHQLAVSPEIQEKLIDEIDQTIKDNEELNYDNISNMKYLDAFLEEVLRYHTLPIRLERTAVQDYKLGDTGLVIPKGTVVAVPVHAIHHDPNYFPDPEKFDPDRFLAEQRKNIIPYTSMPFGIGPRNCLGMKFAQMQIKIALAMVLQRIKFKRGTKTKDKIELHIARTFNRPKDTYLKMEERK